MSYKMVQCERGFKCIKQIPDEIVESVVEAVTLSPDGESLFPDCFACDFGTPDDCSMQIMPDDDGVLHRVKLCKVTLLDLDEPVVE